MMFKKKPASQTEIPQGALSRGEGKYITKFEYLCIMPARIGGQFGTTLTGTIAAAFLHELYFGPVGVSSDDIASMLAVQSTLTTLLGIGVGAR